MICTLHQILFGRLNQESFGQGLGNLWETRELQTRFGWRDLRDRVHFKDLSVDGRIILKRIFKKCDGDMDGIDLAQNRDRCRNFVNAVVKLRVAQKGENFLTG